MQPDTFLTLLKKTILRFPLDAEDRKALDGAESWEPALMAEIQAWRQTCDSGLSPEPGFNTQARLVGKDWPARAESMIGLARMDHLHACIVDVLQRKVPGDLAEIGVWRGGAGILMRAALKAYGDRVRRVWLADSFQGLPKPDPEHYPADAGDTLWSCPDLAVSLEQVKANFARYGLLDNRVRFIPGWFRETLPGVPIKTLALLRLDGDLYESTMVALESLYERVSPGGYVIVDDYGAMPSCRQAVEDFRRSRAIESPTQPIDWTGVFWLVPIRRKEQPTR